MSDITSYFNRYDRKSPFRKAFLESNGGGTNILKILPSMKKSLLKTIQNYTKQLLQNATLET